MGGMRRMYQGNAIMARFRSNLKQIMLNHSAKTGEPLSQRTLAKDTGIALSTISRWYRDDNISAIEPNTLGKLLDYFGVSFDELVDILPDEEGRQS
jgi:transcriptional regulator with XRE-family HTH domain